MRRYIYYTLLLFILILTRAYAQKNLLYDLEALKSAYVNIKQENYSEAYPYFEKMLNKFPKDPTYNYYSGICLLNLERNPSNALKHLRYAATKEVPKDVWYYLGLVYLRNYQFQEALDNFLRFEKIASKQDQKKFKIKNYISTARNGLYLVRYIKEPVVIDKQSVLIDAFYTSYQLEGFEGQFVDYDEFFRKKSDTLAQQSVVFMPESQGRNETIYFSSKHKKRDDLDIYKVTRINDSVWSEAENLGEVINTSFDESYPYLHTDGATLYFASKGHYSMGGYDLYKSSWDWDTQQWTEPENMDFPINSPFDDILFVPSPNKRTALFTSNRETEKSKCNIYKIKMNNSEPYIEVNGYDEILKYAKLDINADEDRVKIDVENKEKYIIESAGIVKIKAGNNFLHKKEYDSLINLAVGYQLQADSLRWVINDKRIAFDNTHDANSRLIIGNEIIEFERDVYLLQKKADSCYERVREIEQKNLALAKNSYVELVNKNAKDSKTDSKKVKDQKFFVEPVDSSFAITKLVHIESKKQEATADKGADYGLRVESKSVYDAEKLIPINEKLEDGILYMIQLGAFSSKKGHDVFKGLAPLSSIKNNNSSIWKYYAGKFRTLDKAEEGLLLVKNKGFRDAYIVAFHNGKNILMKNAIKIENRDTKMDAPDVTRKVSENENEVEELSIIYVLKGKFGMQDNSIISDIRMNLPTDIDLYLEQDQILIKSFSSYEKVYKVKGKLEEVIKNKFEIHAYFAENQIPLDQARKITK